MTLTGTPAEATIVNNSRKGLIGYVLRLEYASGTSDYRRNLNTRGLRLNVSALGLRGRPGFLDLLRDGDAIPPGGTVRLEYPAAVTIFSRSQVASTQPVKVVLDALIFAVSQFVGPDMGQSFEVLANQLIAEQELAQRVSAARNECQNGRPSWQRSRAWLSRVSPRSRTDDREHELSQGWQESLARDLVFVKNRAGEDAVLDVAGRELAIPKLWRSQQ